MIEQCLTEQVFRFLNQKCESYFHQRLKPSKLDWTVVFRRFRKKGVTEEVTKRRAKKITKVARPIVGVTVESLRALKNQKPQERAAARQKAIATSKAAKKEAESKKKAEKAKASTTAGVRKPAPKTSKQQARGAAPKVQAKSR